MKISLIFLTFFLCLSSFAQEQVSDFDGSYSILIESPKLTDITLNQSELDYLYSQRKPNERVVVQIRFFQVILLSETEYAEGIRFVKHTVYKFN